MKITAKTERYFDIERIPESDIRHIICALNEYVRKPDKMLSPDESKAMLATRDLFQSCLVQDDETAFKTTSEAVKKAFQAVDTRAYIQRLAPFGGLMVPYSTAPDWVANDLSSCVQFIYGKQNQLCISYWERKEDFEDCKPADTAIWLRDACVQILGDFLLCEGKHPDKHATRRCPADNLYVIDDVYMAAGISPTDRKALAYKYFSSTKSVSVTKEGESIFLDAYETMCLTEFLNYHLTK